ncbi:hypothetical protein DFH08DRAFT_165745 [Mycena albidolilacea]|uniref:F-box domain-containing protein n=1 Tax=Mycena albidolilacea TaxID=1033008 RepID=A0AAD7AQZ8_9AGAR|nr:hypothetical protein DFH08DRAFT_165745 [Mycena albidolilacea]
MATRTESSRTSMRNFSAQETERTKGLSMTQIKHLIQESDSKISSLENEIAALESESQIQIATVTELRDREQATCAALRSLVAPIRTLPVELLAEIFVLSAQQSTPFYSSVSTIKDAFRVSHVCGYWRQIASGTPRLWARPIGVSVLRWNGRARSDELYADGLRAWFARSTPLSVPVVITGFWDIKSMPETGSRVTGELRRIASRWGTLQVMCQGILASFLMQLTAGVKLDSLEELDLPPIKADVPDFDPAVIVAFATAPRLRKLTMFLTYSLAIPMPWTQLTDINVIDRREPDLFLDIFAQCSNLVRASVRIEGWSVLPPARSDITALDHLQFLTLTFSSKGVHVMPFFTRLSAPALDHLRLHMESHEGAQWDETTFTAFQLRAPNITRLEINGYGSRIESTALRAALIHAPSLTHLSVDHCSHAIDDALLRALHYTDDEQPLVPRLYSLSFINLTGNRLSEDLLASMLASRWWSDVELASRSRPPAVSRWSRLQFGGTTNSHLRFSQSFRDLTHELYPVRWYI